MCRHTGPAGRVAGPQLWPPHSSMGFSAAPRDTCPAPLVGFGVSNNGKERTARGRSRSLLVPSALFAAPGLRGLAWPRLVSLCCVWSSHPVLPSRSPAPGDSHLLFHGFTLLLCRAELAPGLLSTVDEVGATRCLCPAGSAGTSRFGINFRFFFLFSLADLSLEFSRPAVLLYYPHATYLSRLSLLLPASLPLLCLPVAELLPASKNKARWWSVTAPAEPTASRQPGPSQQSHPSFNPSLHPARAAAAVPAPCTALRGRSCHPPPPVCCVFLSHCLLPPLLLCPTAEPPSCMGLVVATVPQCVAVVGTEQPLIIINSNN